MHTIKAELIYESGNSLGEGPFCYSEKCMYWVDIFNSSVFSIELPSTNIKELSLDSYICCAGKTLHNDIIAAGENGVALYDENFEFKKLLYDAPFDTSLQRFNDGKVGPDGAFWAGSMSYEGDKAIGGLYRFGEDTVQILDKMIIPNGIGWSPQGNEMYVTDSGKGAITRWEFDSRTGELSNEYLFIELDTKQGVPDGLCVDESGNIWSACWGGGCILGFDSEGNKIAEIEVEATNTSSCCFGGENYETLFITSAQHGISTPKTTDGAFYKAITGTYGLPAYRFKFV